MRALFTLAILCFVATLCGCASQARPNQVGEIGLNSAYERSLQAENNARRSYDYAIRKTKAFIKSDPAGALVEWYNHDGIWVTLGNTPTKDIVIEATGKPELFRLSLEGYLSQTRWVAATPDTEQTVVTLTLEPDPNVGR